MADKNKPSQKPRGPKAGRGPTTKTGHRGARKNPQTELNLVLMGKGAFKRIQKPHPVR